MKISQKLESLLVAYSEAKDAINKVKTIAEDIKDINSIAMLSNSDDSSKIEIHSQIWNIITTLDNINIHYKDIENQIFALLEMSHIDENNI